MSVLVYPSVPNLMIAFVSSLQGLSIPLADHGASTDLPANYTQTLPFVRVTRVGGSRAYGKDYARIRLETFAGSYDAAESLANEIDARVEFDAVQFTNGDGRIFDASQNVAPAWAAWDDQAVTRFIAAYEVAVQSLLLS